MRNIFVCALFILSLVSCTDNLIVSQYKAMPGGGWSADEEVSFTFTEVDSTTTYDIFINIRNDQNYAYSNLFLITQIDFPNGRSIRDTLEYTMTKPDGQWLGQGHGSIKENKLWYKENIVFPVTGVYTLAISHAMRKNGKVEGIETLEGITDVGFEIEKTE